jgi:hypothetical protein
LFSPLKQVLLRVGGRANAIATGGSLKRGLNAHSTAQFVAGPVLQNFGNRSGTSHLLHASTPDASRITITAVQIFCMGPDPIR